jgi:large subunit ribosomal protein L10
MDGKLLDKAGVEGLAKLPSLDEMRGTLVGLIQAPAAKITRVTQAPAGKLARVIKAREDQLQQGA